MDERCYRSQAGIKGPQNVLQRAVLSLFLLCCLLPFMTLLPVIAATISGAQYGGTILIASNNTSSASGVVALFKLNTDQLIDDDFINSNFNNTAVLTAGGADAAYCPIPGTSNWTVFVASIPGSSSLNYKLYTGGTAMNGILRYIPYTTGMTTFDSNSTEPGSNFTIIQKGHFDTSQVGANCTNKGSSIRVWVSDEEELKVSILDIVNITPYSSTSDGYIEVTNATYNTTWEATSGTVDNSSITFGIGQVTTYTIYRGYLFFDTSSIPDDATIISATLKLYGEGDSTTTDFFITIQNGQPTYPTDPLVTTDYNKAYYSGNGGALTTSGFSTVSYNNIALNSTGLGWINKTGITKLCLRSSRDIAGTTPTGNEFVTVGATERTGTTHDPYLIVNYYKAEAVATSIPIGEHTVKIYLDGTNLGIIVDEGEAGEVSDTTLLSGASVNNTATNWTFCENNAIRYLENQKMWVNSTLVQHIVYEYNTTFSDLSGYNNTATPTFYSATSDSNVTAALISFSALDPAELTDYSVEPDAEIMPTPPTQPSEMYGELNTMHLPGAGFVNSALTEGNIPIALFWIPFTLGLAAGAGFIVYGFTNSLLVQAVVSAFLMFGFALTGGGIIPWWTPVIFIVEAFGIIIARKQMSW